MDKDISLRPVSSLPQQPQKSWHNCISAIGDFFLNKSNLLMLLVLIAKAIVFSLIIVYHFNLIIILCDIIIITVILIGFAIILKERGFSLYIQWGIYVVVNICQLVILFLVLVKKIDSADSSYTDEDIERDCADKDAYHSLMYMNFFLENTVFFIGDIHYSLSRKAKIAHLTVLTLLNILVLCIVCFTYEFCLDVITYVYCFTFGAFCYYGSKSGDWNTLNMSVSMKRKSSASGVSSIRQRNSMTGENDNENDMMMISNKTKGCYANGFGMNSIEAYETMPSFYSSCVVNEGMMIRYQNSLFNGKMQELCVRKGGGRGGKGKNGDENNKSMKTSSNFYASTVMSPLNHHYRKEISNDDCASGSVSEEGLYLNSDCLFYKDDDDDTLMLYNVNNDNSIGGYSERNNNTINNSKELTFTDVFVSKFINDYKSSAFQFMKQSTLQHIKLKERNKDQLNSYIFLGKFNVKSSFHDVKQYEIYVRLIDKEITATSMPQPQIINIKQFKKTKEQEYQQCQSTMHTQSQATQTQQTQNQQQQHHHQQYQHQQLYEIVFYELTDNLRKDKTKIEKKYKNLLLRKINHEFKLPIVLIQNMINESNDTNPSIYIKSINKTMKYATDAILLLVSDLSEYIHLNTLNVEDREMSSIPGSVNLLSLFHDMKNITFIYTKVFNTNVMINYDFDDRLKNGKIMINETKLKQILSTVIINAIKNSSNITIAFQIREKGDIGRNGANAVKAFTTTFKAIEENHKPYSTKSLFKVNEDGNVNGKESGNGIADISSNYIIHSPQAKRLVSAIELAEYDVMITIEDNGPGIERNIMNIINSSSRSLKGRHANNTSNMDDLSPITRTNSYHNQKGLGTGLMICLKLCKDLNIKVTCESLKDTSTSQGTRIQFQLDNEINYEEPRIDSCIYEHEYEGSCYNLTNQSIVTRQIMIEDFTIGLNEKLYLQYDKTSQSNVSLMSNNENNRKSKTCLFFKSKFASNLQEDTIACVYTIMHLESFMLQAQAGTNHHHQRLTKTLSKDFQYSDIPLFNDSDKDFSFFSLDKHGKSHVLKRKNTTCTSQETSPILKKGRNSLNILEMKQKTLQLLNRNNSKMKGGYAFRRGQSYKSGSSQAVSLFKENSINLKGRKLKQGDEMLDNACEEKNNESNDKDKDKDMIERGNVISETSSANADADGDVEHEIIEGGNETKSLIVIVDDNDPNRKAIYSTVYKTLNKQNKGDVYEYKLLSDGVELLYLLYEHMNNLSHIKMIICDESMNFMHGSEAYVKMTKFTSLRNLKEIPFILCSAFGDNTFKEKMVSLGIRNVYEKPLQVGQVEMFIKEYEL